MNIKNKLLISFILFVVILSFFTCSFASSNDIITFYNSVIEDECQVILPSDFGTDGFKYYFVSLSETHISIYISNKPFLFGYLGGYYFFVSDGADCYEIADLKGGSIQLNMFGNPAYIGNGNGFRDDNLNILDLSSGSIFSVEESTASFNRVGSFYSDIPSSNNIIVNHTIYDKDSGSEVFYSAPVTVEQVTIPKIQQVEEIPQMMGQVMKILIPIGLIVFSIGLVIYLTRLVISRVQ